MGAASDHPVEERSAWSAWRNVAVSAAFGVATMSVLKFDWHLQTYDAVIIFLLAAGYIFVGLTLPGPWLVRRPPVGRVLILFGFAAIPVGALLMAAQYLLILGAGAFGGPGPPVHHWPLLLALVGFLTACFGAGTRTGSYPSGH
jgi:hypothetical protein